MFKKDIRVDAFWDDDAKVWVASSEDVTGLITEAETMESLVDKLKILIPELLQANGQINNGDSFDIPLHLVSKREELLKR